MLAKALDTSTTNGNNLLDPIFLSKVVSEKVRTIPTLRNAITRLPWQGNTYNWDIFTDFGNASTAADGATNIALSDAKIDQGNATMSAFYYAAMISNMAIKATEQLLDVVSTRIGQATKQVIRQEGNAIYFGDPNNATSIGLSTAIANGPNGGFFAPGETADITLFSSAVSSLTAMGYPPGVFAVTPGVYDLLMRAAFNKVRFVNLDNGADLGFPTQGLSVCGVPVISDVFATKYVAVSNETLTGSGKTYTFANPNVQRNAGSNFVGTTWTAPVIKVSGVTKTAGTDYTIDHHGNVDYAVGWSKSIQGETLTNSGDNRTYSFANPTVIRQATGVVPTQNQQPQYAPAIYVNGVQQINTTFTQTDTGIEVWSIAQDNLAYTLNAAPNGGIQSITFNTSLSSSDVVTADYSYAATPADLRDACAKAAAIDILTSTAAAPYGDITTGGQMIVQMNGFKTQSAPSGQFGPQIATWQSHVDAVVKRYKAAYLPIGTSFRDDVTLRL